MKMVYQSACPLNCWDSCGLKVTVENDKVIKVEGDPSHPITQGKICGRGRMLETRTNSSKRLLHPLKKVNGEFVQISWDQALNEIADKLANIKEKNDTTAVLHSHDYANNGILKNLDQRFLTAMAVLRNYMAPFAGERVLKHKNGISVMPGVMDPMT